MALKRSSGKELWKKQLNPNQSFKDIEGSVEVDAKRIYAIAHNYALYSLSKKTGAVFWRVKAPISSRFFVGSKRIYFATSSGQVMAVNKHTGKKLWSYDLGKKVSGHFLSAGRGFIVIGSSQGSLYVLDSQTGKARYRFYSGAWAISHPADVESRSIYFVSQAGNLFALKLKKY